MEELVGDRGASRPWATHVQAEANANLGLKGLGIPPPPAMFPSVLAFSTLGLEPITHLPA